MMKDRYVSSMNLPADKLVPEWAQPDYLPVDDEPPSNWNIGFHLADAQVAAGRGDEVAAIHAESGRSFTFKDLARLSDRVAGKLIALGIAAQDRIAYRTVNDPEFLPVVLGIWKAGAVAVPVPVQSKAAEIRHLLADTTPRLMFVHGRSDNFDELNEAASGSSIKSFIWFAGDTPVEGMTALIDLPGAEGRPLPVVDPDHIAIVWHTGGTTGRPKGCYHTHRRFLHAGQAFGKGTHVAPGQRWTAAAPVGHALGLIHHTIYTLLNGATVVFVERFNDAPMILKAIGEHRITTLTALMGSWAKLADALEAQPGAPISTLERCFAMWQSASSSRIYDFWRARGIELLNNFGSTSYATWVLVPPVAGDCPRAALGKALPGYQVEAVEVSEGGIRVLPRGEIGQLAVKGPSGLTYWGLPEQQARDVIDGWSLSDDLIQYDAQGYAHYLGRTDYMISTGGFKVAPAEVEGVLSRHPAVNEIAVVPGPCPTNVEMVVAYVVLESGFSGGDALRKALQDTVRATLSSYKVPRRIEFVDALPRDPVGKVQTRIVKEWAYR